MSSSAGTFGNARTKLPPGVSLSECLYLNNPHSSASIKPLLCVSQCCLCCHVSDVSQEAGSSSVRKSSVLLMRFASTNGG